MKQTDIHPSGEPCRKLVLMRHGEAHQGGVSDHTRSLTPRGVADCQRIGQKLQELVGGIKIVSSDATRTTQTCEELLKSLTDSSVTFDNSIYAAPDAKRLTHCIVEHAHASDKTLMIVGHNPTISQLAAYLSGDHIAFGTSECMVLKSDETDWKTALHSSGTWQHLNYFSP